MATVRSAAMCASLLLLSVSGMRVQAQNTEPKTSFVIDPNRPYVYLKFDHIGPGIPREEREPKTRIWLRIVNNCRVPIVILENGTPEGSPKEERQIMYEVVPTIAPKFGFAVFASMAPGTKPKQKKSVESPSGELDKMPRGYMEEIGSSETIPPGEEILFSIPLNHLSKRWHIEIPYTFDLPNGECCRDKDIGGMPKMAIEYSMWDLPPESQAEIQQK